MSSEFFLRRRNGNQRSIEINQTVFPCFFSVLTLEICISPMILLCVLSKPPKFELSLVLSLTRASSACEKNFNS